ncbi:MAG: hypothetical protein JJT94_13260 [Bernardetiaceae bacterium]|nr:hypothetical protein [Bernardetiaceae bacterium]
MANNYNIPKPKEAAGQTPAIRKYFKANPHLITATAAGGTAAAISAFMLHTTEVEKTESDANNAMLKNDDENQMSHNDEITNGHEDLPMEVEPEPITESDIDKLSFSEAFAQARAEQGAGGLFEWRGGFYGTYYAEEVDENMNPLPEFQASIDNSQAYPLTENIIPINPIDSEPTYTEEGISENVPDDIYLSSGTNDYNHEDIENDDISDMV